MAFILTAFDGTDEGAQERRMTARPGHLEKIAQLKKTGQYILGGAILNDVGLMIGSVIIYDVPDRETLDKILEDEPYINNGVWKKIDIRPFRPAKTE
jgi:uncharacterized protein